MDRNVRMLAKVTLEGSGGLARFSGRALQTVSFACTDPRDVDQLRVFAEAARFFSRGEDGEGVGADARTYVLRIELGDRSRALSIADPTNDKELARLLRFVRALAAELRA